MDTIFYVNGDTLVVLLSGEIDHHVADKIRNDIDGAMKINETTNIVMDFSEVSFMDSSGVGVVLGRYNKVKDLNGTVVIRNCGKLVKQILDMSGVFSLMRYEETEGGRDGE